MKRPFVTIILAGGKGTRMGSSDKHKVCFEVLGVPVIIRALETYNLCGAALNVVVVGMLAETVMATIGNSGRAMPREKELRCWSISSSTGTFWWLQVTKSSHRKLWAECWPSTN